MARNSELIFLNNKDMDDYMSHINLFNQGQGLLGIDQVIIGGQTFWTFGDAQVKIDERYKQKGKGTLLKTYKKLSLDDKKHTFTGKRFKIVRISEGKIHGVPPRFSKYIVLLERVY